MNIDKKVENIFSNMSNIEILNTYSCRTLLDISEPLLFVLNVLNQYYLAYTLQNRTALLRNGTKADVVEVLIVNSTVPKIKMLLEGQMDIRDALSSGNMYRMGKVGNKTFPKKEVHNVSEVESKIPKIGVRFDNTLPNKINVKKALRFIESEAKVYASFAIREENIYSDEVIQIEVESFGDAKNNFQKENYFNVKNIEDIRIEV
ncbi:hypothetical protein RJP21_08730 [Paenibacillus sp. VCA1]|uniref:hypothetical protein n=1 Tax=Paenibacillus sp. VCA1 TaxID=3039148 RepID=UPI002871F413|nr:hypothetical protein [Paenibacillus sp. VCA1]MDR9853684.1 hypothetical protein [Paenibacillus sp. VCA1]